MANYVVIGASSGIGEATYEKLQKNGHRVLGTYHTEHKEGLIHFDSNTADDFSWAPEVVDGLIFCPGGINLKPFHRISPEEFIEDFNFQVGGAIRTIQALLPALKKSEDASVVLLSTVAVQTGFGFHSMVASSKGALEGLTRALAAEYAPKIRFNCIAPSLTETKLASKFLSSEDKKEAQAQRHPLKQIGRPDMIAELAVHLLEPRSGWTTGQVHKIDGGLSSLR